jgi:hypothetical protein
MTHMHRPDHRRAPSAWTALAALAFLASVGCGGATSEPKVTPVVVPPKPARIIVVTAPDSTGAVDSPAGEFVVRVEDKDSRPMPEVRVRFSWNLEGGNGGGFTPSDTMTDSDGIARTKIRLGSIAGRVLATATVDSARLTTSKPITITPGPPWSVVLNPFSLRLFGAGDEATFNAFVVDRYLNPRPDLDFGLSISDSTLLSVEAPTTPGGQGRIRALRGGGSATVTSTIGSSPMALRVDVNALSRTPCTGALSPQDLDFGVVATAADTTFCIEAKTRSARYGLIVYNESTNGAASLGTTVTAYNVAQDFLPSRLPSGSGPLLSRSPAPRRRAEVRTQDVGFHERLLARSRAMRPLFLSARAARLPRTRSGRITAPRASNSIGGGVTSVPAPGDLLDLNVASDLCTNADMRTFRVEAVSNQSIVLADTANPRGGFTTTEYQRFAARFDTLVYPLDVGNFGDPTDIDGNGRVAILFTRAVNELTPPNSGSFVGGFFHPRDLFPRQQGSVDVCPTSNEGELFYMMVPDPSGTVNGNPFSLGFVDTLTTGVLAHEFQHLINASRRLYVNMASSQFEDAWLNEGLSHIAEELLYFHESGYSPRSRLTSQSVDDSFDHWSTWIADDASNFVRFYLYLLDPSNNSPIDAGDALETRGATWAFLRFAVDQSFSSDAGVWQRFSNSTTTGLGTLSLGLQRDPMSLLRDFAVANFAQLSDPRYIHPSWNYPDVFSQLFVARSYPRTTGVLSEGTPIGVSARGASASYYAFAVDSGLQAVLKFGTPQSRPDGNLRFMLLRY